MKKRLVLICIMFVSFMFSSCIIHEWFNNYDLIGSVVGDIDGDGELEPIPGIKITASGSVEGYTDPVKAFSATTEDGSFYLSLRTTGNPKYYPMGKVELIFEDIDGEENGVFKSITRDTDFTKENSSSIGSYSFNFGTINLSE